MVRRVLERHDSLYNGAFLTITTTGGPVRTTMYHPFWVLRGNELDLRSTPRELAEDEDEGLSLPGRWVNSHELRAGDTLIGRDGNPLRVLKIEQEYQQLFPVSNLTIEEDHTFAVGPDSILVHNIAVCTVNKIAEHAAEGGHFNGLSTDQIAKKITDVHEGFDAMKDLGNGRKIYRKGRIILIEDGKGGGTIFEADNVMRYFRDFD